MKKQTIIIFLLFVLLFVPSKTKIEADAIECTNYSNPSNLLNDPACWTSVYTADRSCGWYYTFTEIGCSCRPFNGTTDYRRPVGERCNRGCVNGATFQNYADGCGGTHCTNNPTYPSTWGQSWSEGSSVTSCYYINAVTDWSDCSSGIQFAEAVNWATVSGTTVCSNVPTSQTCVMPLPVNASCGTNAQAYSSTVTTWPSVTALSFCATGDGIVGGVPTDFIAIGGSYNWTCAGSNTGNPALCSASRANPLSVSVNADQTTAEIGEYITWTATASGGTGSYSYAWTGSWVGGSLGTGLTYMNRFGFTGTYTATVNVLDDAGATATGQDSVTVQDNRKPQ